MVLFASLVGLSSTIGWIMQVLIALYFKDERWFIPLIATFFLVQAMWVTTWVVGITSLGWMWTLGTMAVVTPVHYVVSLGLQNLAEEGYFA